MLIAALAFIVYRNRKKRHQSAGAANLGGQATNDGKPPVYYDMVPTSQELPGHEHMNQELPAHEFRRSGGNYISQERYELSGGSM